MRKHGDCPICFPQGKLGDCPLCFRSPKGKLGEICLCPEGVSPVLPEAKRKQKERPPASINKEGTQ